MKRIVPLLSAIAAAAAFAENIPLPSPPPLPPPRIAPSLRDGEKQLEIESYGIDARIDGLFARVRTLVAFENPNPRVMEGELEFPLPDGASVCAFALDVDGRMRDGVVTPKDTARIAFEAEVKAGIDPGIAEHVRGNVWRTRIYPIPAKGARTVRIEYVTPLAFGAGGDAALRLPMPRERLGERSVTITAPILEGAPAPQLGGFGDRRFENAEAVWRVSGIERDVRAADDILVALPKIPDTFAATEIRNGECWFAASAIAPPPAKETPVSTAPAFRILWDASGSRRPEDVELALKAVELLPRDTYYSLVAFRDAPEAERYFSSRAELLGALTNIAYDGGTDFAALAATNRMLTAAPDVKTLLFTDGMDTLFSDPAAVSFGNALALVSGAECDMEFLRLACGGRVLDLATVPGETVAHEILHPSRFLERVEGKGVDLLQGIGQSATGRVIVLGRLAGDSAEIRFDFGGGAKSPPIALSRASAKSGSTIAVARAAKRMAQIAPRSGDFRDEALAIGREYGIAGPDTSLVVLETAAQYAKYNIEPPASDKTLHKQWLKLQPDPAAAKEKKERNESFWFASLKNEWNKRVEWHKDPVPQRKTPSSGLFGAFRRGNSDVEDGIVAAEASAGMPAPVSAASEERRFSRAPARPGNSAARAKQGGESAPDQAASSPAAAQVKLAAWDPKTPYLASLKDCASAHGGAGSPPDMLYRRYLELRKTYAASPAFFLDCAGFFFARGERTLAVRILSNLTEIRLEDPALLRTFAWRLREAGEYARAIATLRKVAELRPEEPHSFRDLALVLSERAKDVRCAADAEEAMALLVKTAFTPWTRQDAGSVALFAVEELNGLADWCAKTAWPEGKAPKIPEWDDAFKYLPDVDLRIVLSWDADNTDIDIHVLEPSGEEAYYRNRLTASGGLVSRDIVTGYGPEEYMQVKGQKGKYRVLTHYYGSSQQKLTGPATATATVYTDWGRPTEKRRILSLRLDKPKEKVAVGEIEFGR